MKHEFKTTRNVYWHTGRYTFEIKNQGSWPPEPVEPEGEGWDLRGVVMQQSESDVGRSTSTYWYWQRDALEAQPPEKLPKKAPPPIELPPPPRPIKLPPENVAESEAFAQLEAAIDRAKARFRKKFGRLKG